MKNYTEFTETYGEGIFYQEIDLSTLNESDQSLLIPEISDLLKSVGISSYIGGFLWTLNPAEYVDWLNEWLPFEERCISFARTALGDILFLRKGEIMLLNSNWGLMDYTIDEPTMFFDHFLTNEQYLDENFNKSVYNQLSNKSLNPDECFGFTPLLSLGGAEEAANLSKVQLKEYLDLLSKSGELNFFKH